ncbi:MAG: tetratricopeptide repeat protein [Verrucomicrobiota bacterium]
MLSAIWKTVTSLIALLGIGWFLFRLLQRSEDPARLLFKWILSAVIVAGTAVFLVKVGGLGSGGSAADFGVAFLIAGTSAACGLVLGIIWAPNIGAMVAKPFVSMFDGGDVEVEARPFYAVAEAKRKMGLYREAIAEIHMQLARFPDDFLGLMLMAEIQAENLNDLPGAQETIERIVRFEGRAPKNVAFALNRLADWHLKFNQDRAAAREALERIPALLPDTELAQMAAQRIAHLTPMEMLLEKKEPSRIALRKFEDRIGLQDRVETHAPIKDPAALAEQYVKHLEEYPLDNEARENLAMIYANHYQRLDLALDQLEQLIAAPHQPAKQVVHWLNVLADLHIKLAGDANAARQALQRIVDTYPKSAAAENALSRMAYLKLELRPQQKSQAVKLGTYEQNIGLKGREP